MSNSKTNHLTDWKSFFLQPSNSTHRQYEALRAFFVEGLPSAEVADRFGPAPSQQLDGGADRRHAAGLLFPGDLPHDALGEPAHAHLTAR